MTATGLNLRVSLRDLRRSRTEVMGLLLEQLERQGGRAAKRRLMLSCQVSYNQPVFREMRELGFVKEEMQPGEHRASSCAFVLITKKGRAFLKAYLGLKAVLDEK